MDWLIVVHRMGKLVQMDVLIVGMKGLGVETGTVNALQPSINHSINQWRHCHHNSLRCFLLNRFLALSCQSCQSCPFRLLSAKNLILAGPKSVSIYDPEPAVQTDLQCNYYLTQAHVDAGVSRAVATAPRLKELNGYVHIDVVADATITTELLRHGTWVTAWLID
jgi:hypothetical protein